MPGNEQVVEAARAAFARYDWPAAFEAFARADAEAPLAVEDLERAGLAAMWVAESDACIDFRQRAFGLRVAAGEERLAAGVAIDLCFDHASRHREAVALGWGQQAARLLEGVEPCSELGRAAGLARDRRAPSRARRRVPRGSTSTSACGSAGRATTRTWSPRG